MTMDLMPILSTLRRHKTAAGLIVLEIAITSAIVCNALHLIANRIGLLNHDSGLPETELVVLDVRGGGRITGAAVEELIGRDMDAIRALPGVKSAALVNQVVYGDNSNNTDVRLKPGEDEAGVPTALYSGGTQSLSTLGLKLAAGRDFMPEEQVLLSEVYQQPKPSIGQVIINRELAARLWPGQAAVGQVLYAIGDTTSTVVGVVERLTHPYPRRTESQEGYAMLFPGRPAGGSYLVRTTPAERDALLRALPSVIERNDASRIVASVRPLSEMRSRYYAQDRAMVWLMGGVIAALLVVTAFGIVGLASFWVQQRTRTIGTRRALGATRGQIRRYFQLENLLLTSAGIAIGMVAAYAISLVLMTQYELPRLPFHYLPIGAAVLWGLGQLAVLAPARRAAALPPVAALRS